MLVLGAQLWIAGDGRCYRLDEGPAQPLVALLDDLAVEGLAAGGIGRGHKPGIGGKLLRLAEPRYVVDLRIDQPGEELADAGDRLQQLDVGIGLGHRPDRCFRLFDPHVDVADEGETTINLDAVDLRDVHLSQLDAAGLAKQVAKLLQLRRLLRIAVEHRDDAVLGHRAQPHVKHPFA